MPVKRNKETIEKCQSKNRNGKPCAAPPVRGTQYCSLHLSPGRAAEIGKQGGAQNRHQVFQGYGEVMLILTKLECRIRELEELKRDGEGQVVRAVPTTSEPTVEKDERAVETEPSSRELSMESEEEPEAPKLPPRLLSYPRPGTRPSRPVEPPFGSIEYWKSRRRPWMRGRL
jgi:hypothetical protein